MTDWVGTRRRASSPGPAKTDPSLCAFRPQLTKNGNPCLQLRSPDPGANPYLAFALLIHAALDGIEAGLSLPASTDLNLFTADEPTLAQIRRLPSSRSEAARLAQSSSFVHKYLPQMLIDAYCE